MLLHQFCGQVELYTGKPAPFEVMTEALLEEIRQFGRRAERCGS
jgi:shikimate dehydrogenase